ncbi:MULTISPECIES: creatininase family protein [Ramlibacter]|uniref:Creatininase family protein n=1 Tax=Ramlibacter pinisoli TaxID=2682844 RepID=A0A6N8ITB4_9BURK|nr:MULTISPECIES: creatininase family protein [Ramlibacter]MBA2964454.1 creatininase family protein [Ramlibacter sp. CGMCC 1.13660]MVQ29420.1 creatininase family protein [Ramlibacter pinisoli]
MRTDHSTYSDLRNYLKNNDTVLIPVGATEQYGAHLATGTELRICEMIATEVGERTGLAVTPIVPVNYSAMFLDFPGTLSVSMETLERYLGEMSDALAGQGFRHFFFVNIHAGSLGPIESVSRSLRRKYDAIGGTIDVFTVMRDVGGAKFATTNAPSGHASEMVTSVALAKCPELVFMDRVKATESLRPFVDGVKTVSSGKVSLGKSSFSVFSDISDYAPIGTQGDPTGATAAQGQQVWDATVSYMSDAAAKFSRMSFA